MRFYDLLQLDPAGLKNEIKNAENKKEKIKACIALPVRPALIVLLAIAIIAPLSKLFGEENNSMLVALFCILLAVRFVDFGYCIKDSMINLTITFALLFAGPVISAHTGPILGLIINIAALLVILVMTSDSPELGNGGLYGFSYVFLVGTPVEGEMIVKRGLLTLLGLVVCGIIFYCKHKDKNKNIRFSDILSGFKLSSKKSQWQIRMALGVSLLIFIGRLLSVERLMWAGFACSSLLSNYETDVAKKRSFSRIFGTIIGMIVFFAVYSVTPSTFHSLFGPACGVVLGFCVEYRYKTAVNCFSALLLATTLYGLSGALLLRVLNNILGVIFAYIFLILFQKIVDSRMKKKERNKVSA